MEIDQKIDLVEKIATTLITICGESNVIMDDFRKQPYESDSTFDLRFPFDILVKPAANDELSAILKLCNKYKIPVTPRGGGSGVTGGALPVQGGIVLSMERFDKIIELNTADGYVIAEAGVVTAHLCEQVEQAGFYFPVAPSSSKFSFVGGNVAENAGSINSCKYGSTAQYVLNLQVVLPSGEIIWTGANVNKNATGLNLTQLFVGSEGTLGIVTQIVYKLIKKPRFEVSLLAGFESLKAATAVVLELKASDLHPSAVELIGEHAIALTSSYLDINLPMISDAIHCQLLIQFQEENELNLNRVLELTMTILEKHSNEEVLLAETNSEKEKLWKLRYSIGDAMIFGKRKYRDIDAVVPVSKLFQYITQVEKICSNHSIELVYFGHAFDGNLHTMLLTNKEMDVHQEKQLKSAVKEIYSFAISLGGVISGEHGIGYLQRDYMTIQFSDVQLKWMKQIKQLFDPENILNPGKMI